MFSFLIKKTFFDMWDNLFKVLLFNLGYLVCLFLFFVPMFFWELPFPVSFLGVPLYMYGLLYLAAAVFCVYSGVVSKVCLRLANHEGLEFRDLGVFLKETYAANLLWALLLMLAGILFFVALNVYGQMDSFLGYILLSITFWLMVYLVIVTQFYYAFQARGEKKWKKLFRKLFLIQLDNTAFSFGLFAGGIVITALSVVMFFLMPGLTTYSLWYNTALKLRMYKYDWLEQHPEADRKKIPWEDLLYNEKEVVGRRTFKGMIFPWKD